MYKNAFAKLFSFSYWRSVFSHSNPVLYLVLKALRITKLGSLISFNAGGYRLYLFPSSISSDLWIRPGTRPYEMLPCLRQGDVLVDVGANVGTTVIPAAIKIGSSGRVYAFEAKPEIFTYLKRNIALNGLDNVAAFNVAVGEEECTVYVSDYEEDERNRIVPENDGVCIKCMRLDNLLRNIDKVDVLKIDAEGYEYFVLKGAVETLKRTVCVNVEIHEANFIKYGYCKRDVYELLQKSGFKCFRLINDKIHDMSVSEQGMPAEYYNIIAVKDVGSLIPFMDNCKGAN